MFAVATPYNATSKTFTSTEALAKGKLPNFGYQLQLGSEGGVMEGFMGDDRGLVEKFLNGMYGGRTSSRRKFMVPEKGVDLDVMREDEVGKTPFFEEKVGANRFLHYFYVVHSLRAGLLLTRLSRNWLSTQTLFTAITSLAQ